MSDDAAALRDAFGSFLTGVTVVTAEDPEDGPRGFTANSFTSVSLDPPLLLVCISAASASLATFTEGERFAVNILSDAQSELATTFARPVEQRFEGVEWRRAGNGQPILGGCAAWFACRREKLVEAGDHFILIGRIEEFESSGARGLGYVRGGYFSEAVAERAIDAAKAARVRVGAILQSGRRVLLLRDGDGFALPSAEMTAPGGSLATLDSLVSRLGLIASVGFIYAVFETREGQNIVYRCRAAEDMPLRGVWIDLDDFDFARIADDPTRAMLERFAEESRLDEFGVYVADPGAGEVRRLTP